MSSLLPSPLSVPPSNVSMSSQQPMTDQGGRSAQMNETSQPESEPETQTDDKIAAPETDLFYRESEIPPWRFAFLCVG